MNNLTEDVLIERKGVIAVTSKTIELDSDNLLKWLLNTIVMVELVNNLRYDADFLLFFVHCLQDLPLLFIVG